MKKILFLTALFAAVILMSCSETVTDPIKDNSSKTSEGQYLFPYDYLQSFEEVKVLDWNVPATKTMQNVNIQIDRNIEDVEDLFVMVIYGNRIADAKGEPALYFVNQPGSTTMKLRLDADKPVKEIKAFVLNRVSEVDLTPPYEDSHRFRGVYSTWQIREEQLVISALPWTPDVIEAFAYIDKPGADELVYLQRPDNSSKIIIPGFREGEIQGVHLFVNSNPLIDSH